MLLKLPLNVLLPNIDSVFDSAYLVAPIDFFVRSLYKLLQSSKCNKQIVQIFSTWFALKINRAQTPLPHTLLKQLALSVYHFPEHKPLSDAIAKRIVGNNTTDNYNYDDEV